MLEELTCNACGAPLQAPEEANYVTCRHCSTQLAVRRSADVTYTEKLDRLEQITERLEDRVDDLSNQQSVDALDRRWEMERERFMITNKHGQRHLPTDSGTILGGAMVGAFGLIWTVMAIGITSSAPSVGGFGMAKVAFPMFGVFFVFFGVASSTFAYSKAVKNRQAEKQYQQARSQIMRQIDS